MSGSPHQDVRLPESVEQSIKRICADKNQPPLKIYARKMLSEIGEQASVEVLSTIVSSNKPVTSFSGFVSSLVKRKYPIQAAAVLSVYESPQASPKMWSPSSASSHKPTTNGESSQSHLSRFPVNYSSNLQRVVSPNISCQLSFEDETQENRNHSVRDNPSHAREVGEVAESTTISPQLMILKKLEYRKLFLVLSYIGRQKLESVVALDGTSEVYSMKDRPMRDFKSEIWSRYGQNFCDESDRSQYLDWDSGKTHMYYSHVCQNGSYHFKIRFLHDPAKDTGFVGCGFASNMVRFFKKPNGSWDHEVSVSVKPLKVQNWILPEMPGLITDYLVSLDDGFFYLSNWFHGDIRQYNIEDPANPWLTGQVWVGGLIRKGNTVVVEAEDGTIYQVDVPEVQGHQLRGGPQMIQLSLDGKRLYVTNSILSMWDHQFYPELVQRGAHMLQIDVDTEEGGLVIYPNFFVDFGAEPDGPSLAHEMRYPGGDCASDIWS